MDKDRTKTNGGAIEGKPNRKEGVLNKHFPKKGHQKNNKQKKK